MIESIDKFLPIFEKNKIDITTPEFTQTLSVNELKTILPKHDGWIIGDDPATREVFTAGKSGLLKAAVKWGVGVDNVDFDACRDLDIPITNTPNMFGKEVADMAIGYLIALARETFQIDQRIRKGEWPKPKGISLSGKTVALVGFGDIGKNTAKRLLAADMNVIAYDPSAQLSETLSDVELVDWPDRIDEADFIVVNCSLTQSSHHMVNADVFSRAKDSVRIVNIGRGLVIDEQALINALQSGKVYSAALDVFEEEPLPKNSYLREHPRCIFGSHNASNTSDAVERTSKIAIEKLFGFLEIVKKNV